MKKQKKLTLIIFVAVLTIITLLMYLIVQRQQTEAQPRGGSLVSIEDRQPQEVLLLLPEDMEADGQEEVGESPPHYEQEEAGVYEALLQEFTQEFTPVFTSEALPAYIIDFIYGRTFRSYAPFELCFLTYLNISFVDFEGNDQTGNMIVAAEIGEEVLEIFQEIYESGFPIYSIKLMDYFDGVDYYSLAANNSSAFNFRYIAGTNRLSRHAFGMAIDINPIQNPYIRGETIKPSAGEVYIDRSYIRPGMISPGDAVYTAFTSRGWTWGGNWTTPRDYHHFERN